MTNLTTGANGLPRFRLEHASGSRAEVYLHGAHVASWVPAGRSEALFLSRASAFQPGAAIRGGIPVIFPQFADLGALPKHGFARTREWTRIAQDDPAAAVLELRDDAQTRALWPHSFRARIRVQLSEHALDVELSIENTGGEEFAFTAALHTYLRVADVRKAGIVGLQGVEYQDKVLGKSRIEQSGELMVRGEIDRVYRNAPAEVRVLDRGGGRSISARSAGFPDVVIWNPWADKARALPDLEDDDFERMVCVEAGKIMNPIALQPGAVWRGSQQLQSGEL